MTRINQMDSQYGRNLLRLQYNFLNLVQQGNYGAEMKKNQKLILLAIITISIAYTMWRMLCWEMFRIYDTDALKCALYNEAEQTQRAGRYTIDSIFEGIKFDAIIDLIILVVLFVLIVSVRCKSNEKPLKGS